MTPQLADEFFDLQSGAHGEWSKAIPAQYRWPIVLYNAPKPSSFGVVAERNPGSLLESVEDGPPSRLTPALDVPPNSSERFNHSFLRASFRLMTQEEEKSIRAFKMNKSIIKAADVALSFAF